MLNNVHAAQVAKAVGEDVKEEIVTLADQLREEGRREGRDEGRRDGLRKGRRDMLLELLSTRFGELPESAVARIDGADLVQLGLWAKRVLIAPTLADVLGDA